MRLHLLLLLCGASLLHSEAFASDLLTHQRNGNIFTLTLTDGTAAVEWVSSSTFRFRRNWTGQLSAQSPIQEEKIEVSVKDRGDALELRSAHVVLEVVKAGMRLRVRRVSSGGILLEEATGVRQAENEVLFERVASPQERIYGVNAQPGPVADRRGLRLRAASPFLMSSLGYGLYHPGGGQHVVDLGSTRADRFVIRAPAAGGAEYYFYYGPTPKEIYEEHKTIAKMPGALTLEDFEVLPPSKLPKDALPLPPPRADWDGLCQCIQSLVHASLSAAPFPAFDLGMFRKGPDELFRRAAQLAGVTPIALDSAVEPLDGVKLASRRDAEAMRRRLGGYLLVYAQETRDRGFPVIHPLLMQFPKDAEAQTRVDEFMLGDEFLVAPVCAAGGRRSVYLPMGNWTDLRTNRLYAGRQTIEMEAAPDHALVFAKNGSIVPFGVPGGPEPMEVHYWPKLGGEFFLYEPAESDYTMFHAAPAGDYYRLETESLVDRAYLWHVHHLSRPREVAEGEKAYTEVTSPQALKPGCWFYDDSTHTLRVSLRAEARKDHIINISF